MKSKYYYIFGTEAVQAWISGPKADFIQLMKNDNGSGILYEYDDSCMYPNNLLYDFSGWGDYTEISETDYEYLQKEIYG